MCKLFQLTEALNKINFICVRKCGLAETALRVCAQDGKAERFKGNQMVRLMYGDDGINILVIVAVMCITFYFLTL